MIIGKSGQYFLRAFKIRIFLQQPREWRPLRVASCCQHILQRALFVVLPTMLIQRLLAEFLCHSTVIVRKFKPSLYEMRIYK